MKKCRIQKAVEQYLLTKDSEDMNHLYNILKKYTEYTVSRDFQDKQEVESELNEVIAISLQKYDVSQGILFKTYFWTCWQNFKGTQNIRKNAKKRQHNKNMISLNQKIKEGEVEKEIGETIKCPRNDIKQKIKDLDFEELLTKITDQKDKYILQGMYEGKTQTEIGNELNMSNAAVCIRLRRMATRSYGKLIYNVLKGMLV